jgi:hypothetical protein
MFQTPVKPRELPMLKVTLDIPPAEPAGLGPVIIVALAMLAAAVVLVGLRRSRRGRR